MQQNRNAGFNQQAQLELAGQSVQGIRMTSFQAM